MAANEKFWIKSNCSNSNFSKNLVLQWFRISSYGGLHLFLPAPAFFYKPDSFFLGVFRIDWYSLMYIFGFIVVYLLLKYRIKKGENNFEFNASTLFDLLSYSFWGLIIGARLGYVLFYNLPYYLSEPLAIISPFDPNTHEFIGLYGMSYHGGLIGTMIAFWIFSRKNKIHSANHSASLDNFSKQNFFQLANFIIPAIPAGYFFGRIGNFLNGELYGKATENFWGMYFPSDNLGILRHPSQIYEAILEGIILFLVLWVFRNKKEFQDKLFGAYLFGYAFFRIGVEFFREPDSQIGYIFGFLTLGQILSFGMLLAGTLLIFYPRTNFGEKI